MLALGNLPQDGEGAVTGVADVRVVEGIDRRQPVGEDVDDADHAQHAVLAKLDQPAVDMGLQQEVGVLVTAVLVHAAAGVAGGLVVLIELIVLLAKCQAAFARGERGVLDQRPALAAVGHERLDVESHWLAFTAGIAIRTIGKHAAAAKTGAHQFAVGRAVDQMCRCRHLRARDASGKVGTAVRRRRIELQQREWRQVAQVGHGRRLKCPSMALTGQ